ncbi:unnamed protein product [Rotaria sordida]|uniref:Uncharacterized protein n=1 Tax=Rotaria sordida TaxID=392033 RepID=A0A813NBY4_9BILA|nr:unnamed protein product [Rotaria sordida]
MTNPAPAADATKEVKPPVKAEGADAATAAKAKLQDDADGKAGTDKAKTTDGKTEVAKKPEEEKSWLDKAREEALDFLGFNGSSAAKAEPKKSRSKTRR